MGSISQVWIPLERATTLAPRIVVARVLDTGAFRFPGTPEIAPQKDDESLPFLRVQILRTIKGKEERGEIRIFDPRHWYHHTHSEMIRAGIISFAEAFYRSSLPLEEIGPEVELLLFLGDEPPPPAFPPGSVFMKFGAGFERAGREGEVVAALREGPRGELNSLVDLKPRESVRIGALQVRHLGQGHKRPTNDGPRCEFVELGLEQAQASGSLRLNHVIQPDGKESWDAVDWEGYRIQLRGISPDGSCTIVVQPRQG